MAAYFGKGLSVEIRNRSDRTAIKTYWTVETSEKGHSQSSSPGYGQTDLIIEPGKAVKVCSSGGELNPVTVLEKDPANFDFKVIINKVVWEN